MLVTGAVRLPVLEMVEGVLPLTHTALDQASVSQHQLLQSSDMWQAVVSAAEREPEWPALHQAVLTGPRRQLSEIRRLRAGDEAGRRAHRHSQSKNDRKNGRFHQRLGVRNHA